MTKTILSTVLLLAMVISFGAGCDWDHDHYDDYYRTSRYGDRYDGRYAEHDRDWDRGHRDHDWYHDRDDD